VNSYTPYNHPSFRKTSAAPVQEVVHRPIDRMARVVTSESLFRGSQEIGIEHEGSMYRLKITRQGKLILNK
jgi:hemin uptake protein HemP